MPSEVVEVYEGQDGSSSDTATASTAAEPDGGADTGPVADGSGSATGSGDTGNTAGLDPGSGTSTGAPTTASTGDASTGSDNDVSDDGDDGDDGPPPQSCAEIYGTAPGYVPCGETDDQCTFNATMSGNDCHMMCGMFGGTCIDSLDNPNAGGQECVVQGDSTCENDSKSTTICICSK